MLERINKLLNVSKHEWPRILVAWSMTFLSRVGFIVGWSALVATFLGKMGIERLPFLFLFNAILVIAGVLLFRPWIHKVRRELLITSTALTAAAFIVGSVFFIQNQTLLAFGLLLLVEGVLISQLNILLSLFNEDLFTPLESQRTFPIVESAETLGGIAGGLILTGFANEWPVYKFLLIWAVALLLILPLVLRFNPKTMEVPKFKEVHHEKKGWKEHFQKLRRVPFLRSLMIIVALHWAIMNMVEFQYTKAIQQDVYGTQEETLVQEDHVILAAEEEENYDQMIAKKMGTLHVIFNTTALGLQLIFASRILTSLGVVSSLMVHPLVAFMNILALTLRFGFITGAVTRGGYELTGILFKSAYDSSYYAIPHEDRDDVKEFMQGIMKPLGAILGTLSILIFSLFLQGPQETLGVNLMLLVLAFVMVLVLLPTSKRYTDLSEQNLSRKLDLSTRLNAVEILGQNGHQKNTPSLYKILNREGEAEILKVKIMKSLGERHELESVGVLLNFLNSPSSKLRLAAVLALRSFKDLQKSELEQAFTKHRVINEIKHILEEEKEDSIREELMFFFYELDPVQLIEFLFKMIEKEQPRGRSGFIRMLRLFKDPNLKYYLEPHLKGSSPELRSASVIALWNFEELKPQLKHTIRQMFESPKLQILELGILTAGEVGLTEERERIKTFLGHSSLKIHEAALLALAQMEDHSVLHELVKRLSDPLHPWFERTEELLKKFTSYFRRLTQKHIDDSIRKRIGHLIRNKELDKGKKHELKKLYEKIGAHHQAHLLEE